MARTPRCGPAPTRRAWPGGSRPGWSVLYVRPFSAAAGVGAGAATSMQEAYDAVAAELRQTAEEQRARLGIDIVFVERDGNPFTEIVRLAGEIQADAVIVGASTKAGHRFVGSLAVHLVRASHWPVTVVP